VRVTIVGPTWHARWTNSVRDAFQELQHTATVLEYPVPRGLYTTLPWLPRKIRNHLQGPIHRTRAVGQQAANYLFGRRLIAHVEQERPDLVLLLKSQIISPAMIAALKRSYAVPVATWWVDDPFEFPSAIAMAPYSDRFFVFSRHWVRRLQSMGVSGARFLPCAYDPEVYRPLVLSAEDRQTYEAPIAFIGTRDRHRDNVLATIGDLPLAIWGPAWDGACALGDIRVPPEAIRGSGLTPEEVAKALNAVRISINVHKLQSRDGGVNMRTFEAAACGAFQLVDAIPDLEELFIPGEEVILYHDTDELRRLALYYLDHPDEAAAIAAKAQARSLREHTFRHRMATLLDMM